MLNLIIHKNSVGYNLSNSIAITKYHLAFFGGVSFIIFINLNFYNLQFTYERELCAMVYLFHVLFVLYSYDFQKIIKSVLGSGFDVAKVNYYSLIVDKSRYITDVYLISISFDLNVVY